MPIQCPNCGSRFLRESKPRDASEKFARWRFISPLRCLDCKTRFVSSTVNVSDMRFAHCPQCDRMDLNRWTGKNYDPPFWVGLWAKLGAKRWRCEYCRVNFASFRNRKEVFTFKRWVNMKTVSAVAEGRARMAVREDKAEEQREMDEAIARLAAKAEAEAEAEAAAEAELIAKGEQQVHAEAKAEAEKRAIARAEAQARAKADARDTAAETEPKRASEATPVAEVPRTPKTPGAQPEHHDSAAIQRK